MNLELATNSLTNAGVPIIQPNEIDIDMDSTIGKGNFASVFPASWNDQTVAVKKLTLMNMKSLEEPKILSMLHHKNIIKYAIRSITHSCLNFLFKMFWSSF